MSWSIGFTGARQDVLDELRKQIQANDGYCQLPLPQGMSDEENQLRRQAQTLLYAAVLAHNVPVDSPAWINSQLIEAKAMGSQSRDSSGVGYQTLSLSVSVHKE